LLLSALCATYGAVRGQSRGKEDSIMRDYELVIIIQPDLDENAVKGIVDKLQALITEAGGTVAKIDKWGKKRLAYAINKRREGQYVLFEIQMQPAFSAELERNLRFMEPVIRFSIINRD